MNSVLKVNLFFWLLIFSYSVTLYLKVTDILPTGLIRSYYNDLICIPIVLYVITWVLRLFFQNRLLHLDWVKILVAVISFSITFEWIGPKYNTLHTADIIDVVCYGIGGVVFWKFSDKF